MDPHDDLVDRVDPYEPMIGADHVLRARLSAPKGSASTMR
jgi:hypothetical protein